MKKIVKFMKLVMVSIIAFSQLGNSFVVLADTVSNDKEFNTSIKEEKSEDGKYVNKLVLTYGNGNFDETNENKYIVTFDYTYIYLDDISGSGFSDKITVEKTASELNKENTYEFVNSNFKSNGNFNIKITISYNGVELYSGEDSFEVRDNLSTISGYLTGNGNVINEEDGTYTVDNAGIYTQKLNIPVGELSLDKEYEVTINDELIGTYTGSYIYSNEFDGKEFDLSNVLGGEYTNSNSVVLKSGDDTHTYTYEAKVNYTKNNDSELSKYGLEFKDGYLIIDATNYDKNENYVITAGELKDLFKDSGMTISVLDNDGNEALDDNSLMNNYKVNITNGVSLEYTVVIRGDITSDNVFDMDDLSGVIDSYLNNEKSLSMDIYKNKDDEEFGTITYGDIGTANNMLRDTPLTDNDIKENENLSLVLGDIPENVFVGDSFEVNVLIQGDVNDFIDGIDGFIDTSDNLSLTDIKFNDKSIGKYKDNHFVFASDDYLYDGDTIVTLVFTANGVGSGSGSISGNIYKVTNGSEFDNLEFSTQIIRNISSNNELGSLKSNVGTFDKEFDKDITSYVLTVPYDTKSVILSGSTFDVYSTVDGLYEYELTGDETIINITVTAEDGSKRVYTVKVIKEAKKSASTIGYVYSSNNYLKSLEISDFDIDFDKFVNEYSISVGSDINSLDIVAVAEDSRARVEITGNEKFKTGDNVVSITVTAENGDVNVYKINVNKKAEKKSASTVDSKSNNTIEKIVIVVLIILVVFGLLYLIFKKDDDEDTPVNRKSNKNN